MIFDRSSPDDEPFYELVAREIAAGQLHAGLWTRCMTDARFDEKRAKTNYIKRRVIELKREHIERVAELEREHAVQEITRRRLTAQQQAQDATNTLNQLRQQEFHLKPFLRRRSRVILTCELGSILLAIALLAFTAADVTQIIVLGSVGGSILGSVAAAIIFSRNSQHRHAANESDRIDFERTGAQRRFEEAQKVLRDLSN